MSRKVTDNDHWVRAGLVGALLLMTLPALAASPRLDDANAHLVKAAALLRAAGFVGESNKAKMHRDQAIKLIERAQRQIARSKQAATKGGATTNSQAVPPKGKTGPGFLHK